MSRFMNIKINGVDFELDTKVEGQYLDATGRTLYDCYTRCSVNKERVWEYWKNWASKSDYGFIQVASYNSMIFTIEGMVRDYISDDLYRIRITPTHNYAFQIIENEIY